MVPLQFDVNTCARKINPRILIRLTFQLVRLAAASASTRHLLRDGGDQHVRQAAPLAGGRRRQGRAQTGAGGRHCTRAGLRVRDGRRRRIVRAAGVARHAVGLVEPELSHEQAIWLVEHGRHAISDVPARVAGRGDGRAPERAELDQAELRWG